MLFVEKCRQLILQQVGIIEKSSNIYVYERDYGFKLFRFVDLRRDKRGSLLTMQSCRSANDAAIYSLATNWFAKFAKTNFGVHHKFCWFSSNIVQLFTSAEGFTCNS